jgi:hypothetical protein
MPSTVMSRGVASAPVKDSGPVDDGSPISPMNVWEQQAFLTFWLFPLRLLRFQSDSGRARLTSPPTRRSGVRVRLPAEHRYGGVLLA